MDAESLVQIERIVVTTVTGAEARLRKETEGLGASLRREFAEKTEALGTSLERQITEKTEALGTSLRREITDKTEALGTSLRQEFDAKVEEVKRYSGVLHEDLCHRLDIVVEGHQGLRRTFEDMNAKNEREFLETRALIQLSYRQLQDRVEVLEQRVQIIEKRIGLSA